MEKTFRTPWRPEGSVAPIDLSRPMLLLGSCFAANIGSRLRYDMAPATVNPTGTLFNPQSIANVCLAALHGATSEYELHGELWDSWLLPTEFSSPDRPTAEKAGADALQTLREALLASGTLIVTFGTAVVYVLTRPPYPVVSNCHKQPSSLFVRDMLSVQNVVSTWQALVEEVRQVNPSLRIIFTVSPVRHVRDGMHVNTLSKATLQLAVDTLVRTLPDCDYFPAYEIMLDDLRDYRWCAEDMAHPSPEAADYIYRLFCDTLFTADDRKALEKGHTLRTRLCHRPLHPDTHAAARFAEDTKEMADRFLADHPLFYL